MNIDRIMEAQDHNNVFYTLDGYFTSIDYGFLMRKDWEYAVRVSELVRDYRRRGLIDQMIRKSRRPQASLLEHMPPTQLSLTRLMGLFYAIFVGGLVAISLSIIDCICGCRKARNRNNRRGELNKDFEGESVDLDPNMA